MWVSWDAWSPYTVVAFRGIPPTSGNTSPAFPSCVWCALLRGIAYSPPGKLVAHLQLLTVEIPWSSRQTIVHDLTQHTYTLSFPSLSLSLTLTHSPSPSSLPLPVSFPRLLWPASDTENHSHILGLNKLWAWRPNSHSLALCSCGPAFSKQPICCPWLSGDSESLLSVSVTQQGCRSNSQSGPVERSRWAWGGQEMGQSARLSPAKLSSQS